MTVDTITTSMWANPTMEFIVESAIKRTNASSIHFTILVVLAVIALVFSVLLLKKGFKEEEETTIVCGTIFSSVSLILVIIFGFNLITLSISPEARTIKNINRFIRMYEKSDMFRPLPVDKPVVEEPIK